MPRKNLIRSKIFPYHVTLRSNNREWFKLPMDRVWQLMTDELYRISIVGDARVHAFTLMSNHLHLLISTLDWDLGKVMSEFGGSVTRSFNRISGRSGHLFGGRYHWSIIQTSLYYAYAYKYLYRNPIRAGLAERVEDYPFATLNGLLGNSRLPFPVYFPEIERLNFSYIPEGLDDMLLWLNEPFRKEVQEAIAKGLRRKIFELPRDPQTNHKTRLFLP
jgi:putative transposase